MRCPSCTLRERDLIAILDGEASRAVAARAAGCAICQGRLAGLRATRLTLRSGTPLRDNPSGRAVLRARLADAAARERGGRRPWRQPTLGRAALPLVLLLLVVAGGDLLGRDAIFWPPRCIVTSCDLQRPAGDDRPRVRSATAMRIAARLNQTRALAWAATTATRRDPAGRSARFIGAPSLSGFDLRTGRTRSTGCARSQTPGCLSVESWRGTAGRPPAGRFSETRVVTWR